MRGVLFAPLIMVIAVYRNQLFAKISTRDWKILSVRVFAEAGATVCFLTALANMPLANITAILQAIPLALAVTMALALAMAMTMAMTMAAALFLGAEVGWRRWTATFVGFIGVMVIVRPGMEGFTVSSLYALAAVAFVTLRDTSTRKLSPSVPSLMVALLTALCKPVRYLSVSVLCQLMSMRPRF